MATTNVASFIDHTLLKADATRQQIETLCQEAIEHKFSELHVFPYSKRTGTPAARMEDQVDEGVKNERVHRLITLSDQLAKEYTSQFENDVLEIIPEEEFSDGLYVGYTDNYLKVVFPAKEEMIGKLVKVKITKAGYPYNEGKFVKIVEDDIKAEVFKKEEAAI